MERLWCVRIYPEAPQANSETYWIVELVRFRISVVLELSFEILGASPPYFWSVRNFACGRLFCYPNITLFAHNDHCVAVSTIVRDLPRHRYYNVADLRVAVLCVAMMFPMVPHVRPLFACTGLREMRVVVTNYLRCEFATVRGTVVAIVPRGATRSNLARPWRLVPS